MLDGSAVVRGPPLDYDLPFLRRKKKINKEKKKKKKKKKKPPPPPKKKKQKTKKLLLGELAISEAAETRYIWLSGTTTRLVANRSPLCLTTQNVKWYTSATRLC